MDNKKIIISNTNPKIKKDLTPKEITETICSKPYIQSPPQSRSNEQLKVRPKLETSDESSLLSDSDCGEAVIDSLNDIFNLKHPCQLLQEFIQYKKYEDPIYNFKEEKFKNSQKHICNLRLIDLKLEVETWDTNKKNSKSKFS